MGLIHFFQNSFSIVVDFARHLNWVDFVVLAALGWYAYDGWRRGFLFLSFEAFGFAAALIGGLLGYAPLAQLIASGKDLGLPLAKPLSFAMIWMAIEYTFGFIGPRVYNRLPERFRASKLNHTFGAIPGILNGLLILSVMLSIAVDVPAPAFVKNDILSLSQLGGRIVAVTSMLDRALPRTSRTAVHETLSFMTVKQEGEDSLDLHFKTTAFAPVPDDEKKLFALTNEERVKRGLLAYTWDDALVPIARGHSADMLTRGYISHIAPDGKSPVDRANAAAYTFRTFGENIALAPGVLQAHRGLMDSPGHRANILSTEYTKIGIGIEDTGMYGVMVTQNFAD